MVRESLTLSFLQFRFEMDFQLGGSFGVAGLLLSSCSFLFLLMC